MHLHNNTVVVGSQCWMKENLKTSRYKNGALIPTGLNGTQCQTTTSGACADYNNDPANTAIYGKLYNWYAITDSRGLVPEGWHIPSMGEWNGLINFLKYLKNI